jgi:hypothetical protein
MFLMMQILKKEKYVLHVAKMLGFLGEKPAEAKCMPKDLSEKSQCLNQDLTV